MVVSNPPRRYAISLFYNYRNAAAQPREAGSSSSFTASESSVADLGAAFEGVFG
jgi:hypothetical protein